MMKLDANLGVGEILLHLIIWVILSVITLGIALFFLPYSFSKFVLNRTHLIDEHGVARKLVCEFNVFANIGHIILWIIISIVTLGIGYIFYLYRVWGYAMRHTTVR